jgi:hypothetical protein
MPHVSPFETLFSAPGPFLLGSNRGEARKRKPDNNRDDSIGRHAAQTRAFGQQEFSSDGTYFECYGIFSAVRVMWFVGGTDDASRYSERMDAKVIDIYSIKERA